MFTGIIDVIGGVISKRELEQGCELEIQCPYKDFVQGESIAVNGVCLSVVRWRASTFSVQASAETIARTTIGGLRVGDRVHLERALAVGDRLGGHFVTGHVDGVGVVSGLERLGEALKVTYTVPPELAPFLAPKGSVAVDGVSLTINRSHGVSFDVVLVPITLSKTTLGARAPGDRVNIEVDVIAKYIARLLGKPGVDGVPPSFNPELGMEF
ncbi:MAG: riboflavin synthase [Deltaproteobacteria bacterium]|nr:riboflavin synthase [Deltaproteobacteria bacterium]